MARYCIVTLLWCLVLASAARADRSNWETWATASAQATVGPGLNVVVAEEVRANGGQPYYTHTDINLLEVTHRQFEVVGVGVRHANLRQTTADGFKWVDQNLLYVNGTAIWPLGRLRLEDRNTIEYRFQVNPGGRWRYRNRAMLVLPLKTASRSASVYLADEATFDLSGPSPGTLYRNRVSAGVLGPLTQNTTVEIFLQVQQTRKKLADEGETFEALSAIGFKVRTRF